MTRKHPADHAAHLSTSERIAKAIETIERSKLADSTPDFERLEHIVDDWAREPEPPADDDAEPVAPRDALETPITELFGEPVYTYTSEQAVEDGVLVHAYPEQFPWLLVTAAVYGACDREVERGGRTLDQCLIPLMQDAVREVRRVMSRNPKCDLVKLEHTVAGEVWVQPNEKGGMTIMTPADY